MERPHYYFLTYFECLITCGQRAQRNLTLTQTQTQTLTLTLTLTLTCGQRAQRYAS